MKTLTFHGIDPKFFGKIQLKDYQLTFDDGLYSQYYYWMVFKNIPTEKIFFITTNFIQLSRRKRPKGFSKKFPDCFDILEEYRETGNREHYMTLAELKEIQKDGAIIGGHGHDHIKFYLNRKQMEQDTIKMMEWFEEHLGFRPEYYAYPHYVNPVGMNAILKEHGIKKTFGNWRIEVEQEINLLSNV